MLQARELLGEHWCGNLRCTAPVVVCADMNMLPNSGAYRIMGEHMQDAQRRKAVRPRPGWDSRGLMMCLPPGMFRFSR